MKKVAYVAILRDGEYMTFSCTPEEFRENVWQFVERCGLAGNAVKYFLPLHQVKSWKEGTYDHPVN